MFGLGRKDKDGKQVRIEHREKGQESCTDSAHIYELDGCYVLSSLWGQTARIPVVGR
jgi:hypothetical protein